MPSISKQKKDKISEQILHYLFEISPNSAYTNKIAEEIARDEEFIKLILVDLAKQDLVVCIDKNPSGVKYSRRQRWRLSSEAFAVYKQHQSILNKRVAPQNSSQSINESEFNTS